MGKLDVGKIHEVRLVGLILDPVSKSPVMLLKVLDKKKVIPIWIGEFEANAITMELESILPPRPMTHDLISKVLHTFTMELEKVIIDDLIENTYHAKLYIRNKESVVTLDCRPSDAIALALKNQANIYISEDIISSSTLSDFFIDYLQHKEQLEDWFNSLKPEDFGNIEQ